MRGYVGCKPQRHDIQGGHENEHMKVGDKLWELWILELTDVSCKGVKVLDKDVKQVKRETRSPVCWIQGAGFQQGKDSCQQEECGKFEAAEKEIRFTKHKRGIHSHRQQPEAELWQGHRWAGTLLAEVGQSSWSRSRTRPSPWRTRPGCTEPRSTPQCKQAQEHP